MTTAIDPPLDARGLSAARWLANGDMRQYTAVEWPSWSGVEHFVRTLWKLGYVKQIGTEPGYAVLDVLDADGDIVGHYDVPTAAAFAYIKRKLQLRVESTDGVE